MLVHCQTISMIESSSITLHASIGEATFLENCLLPGKSFIIFWEAMRF